LGIAEYIDVRFMFDHSLGVVNAVLMTVLVLVGFFRLWRYAYLGTLLLFHLHYAARFSQGEISHGSNFVGTAVLLMAVATLVFQHRKEIRRATLGLCYFFFGLGYTTAALCKLGGTGLTWSDGRHLWMWIQERTIDKFSLIGTVEYNWLPELAIDHYLIATAILTFGLLTEFFAFLFWFKRTRPLAGTLLVGMHIGIWGVMRLTFSANTYMLFMLAYPFERLIDWGLRRLGEVRFEKIRELSLRFA
ncbi:MAG: hypothetical protein MI865_00485, partial [Proteobacteria bacterium]|nr:hypothetical protein [Pseudomonadota bacterium]